jgi:hypothetical protein
MLPTSRFMGDITMASWQEDEWAARVKRLEEGVFVGSLAEEFAWLDEDLTEWHPSENAAKAVADVLGRMRMSTDIHGQTWLSIDDYEFSAPMPLVVLEDTCPRLVWKFGDDIEIPASTEDRWS